MTIKLNFLKIKMLILISILFCNCGKDKLISEKQSEIYPTILFKIGDFNITEVQFKKRMEKINRLMYYKKIENLKAIRETWDVSLKMGLILAECYQMGFDKDSSVVVSYEEEKKKVFEKYVRMIPGDILEAITDELIKESWERSNRSIRVGHILIKDKNNKDIDIIRNKLEKGIKIEDLSESREIIKLAATGRLEIELKDITGGDLLPAVERQVWKMQIGEFGVIQTKSRCHIITIEGIKVRNRKPLSKVKEQIQENIARAVLNEHENSYLYTLGKKEVWIDEEKLTHLDLFDDTGDTTVQLSRESKGSRIAVRLKRGDKFTIEDIQKSIMRLPKEDQRFFRNKEPQLLAIKNLIMRISQTSSYFEQKMKESWMVEELIRNDVLPKMTIKLEGQEILQKSLETGLGFDSSAYKLLGEKENEYLRNYLKMHTNSTKAIREQLIALAYRMQYDKNTTVEKKMQEYRQRTDETLWATDIKADFLDEFTFINNNLIQQELFKIQDNIVAATWNSGKLTFGELRDIFRKYPNSTLQEIQESEEFKELALYRIIKERCPQVTKNFIKVNKHILQQFDPLWDSRGEELINAALVPNDEIIARYGSHTMTVGDLKKLVRSWPEQKLNQFIQHRFTIIKKYLEGLLWVEKAVKLGLDGNVKLKIELHMLKEWLMLEYFYKKFIYVSPVFVDNEYLKEWLSRFIASEEKDKLQELTIEFRKKHKIEVNKKLMGTIGLSIDTDFVCF